MSCILRVSGESLGVGTFLSTLPLVADRIWRKGEPRGLKGKFHSDSGANFVVSEADLDEFHRQLEEATQFLEQHATAIAKIAAYPAVESAILDFGVALNEGYVSQSSYLPPTFIKLAANAGIGIEISHYACSRDDEVS